jgi:hypothetical protein
VGCIVGVSAWCRVGEYARATAVEVEMKVVIRNVHSQRLGGAATHVSEYQNLHGKGRSYRHRDGQ